MQQAEVEEGSDLFEPMCLINVIPLNAIQATGMACVRMEDWCYILQRALGTLDPGHRAYKDFVGMSDHMSALLQQMKSNVH